MTFENEILRTYQQIVEMQHAQGRLIDQQATLLENQDSSISELISEVENVVNAIRGSVDGTTPSIRESLRALEKHLEKVEDTMRAGLGETKSGLEDLRQSLKKIEQEAINRDARISVLEKDAGDDKRRRGVIISVLVSLVLILVTAFVSRACDAWLTIQ